MKYIYTTFALNILALAIFLLSCKEKETSISTEDNNHFTNKIDGLSFVSPANPFPAEDMAYTQNVAANWLAVSPFAFSASETSSNVIFDMSQQWWGETPEGATTIIDYARQNEMKVMLKPQVWIPNGWVGYFNLSSEEAWQEWEADYMAFIMRFAKIAAQKEVELFCIGTEFRTAVQERPQFWNTLIDSVKSVYSGKLTYAANWDDYQNIPFWEQMDYIGVDAYFPLVEAETPTIDNLLDAWQPIVQDLSSYSKQNDKSILFTEYGYMSVSYTAWQNWENENNLTNLAVNLNAQSNAFEALFQSLWGKEWMAGGFIWKWYDNYNNAGGNQNKDYTPQRKPVEATIKKWYEK